MECRKNCGACCIVPSISSSFDGMPDGKKGGIICIQLNEDYSCKIYEQRPAVCRNFKPDLYYCGSTRQEAIEILSKLEILTS